MSALAWLLAILLAGFLLLNWLANTSPKNVKRTLFLLGALALGAFGLVLLFTGRLATAVPALATALALYYRYRKAKWFWDMARSWAERGQTAAGHSTVETDWLNMQLDHDSGDLDGEIRKGSLQGRRLSDLSEADLRALYDVIAAADAESLRLYAAYLDRRLGADWRSSFGLSGDTGDAAADDVSGPMTESEALAVLGLPKGAGKKEIRAAHRRLLQKIHPDHGGSNYLAAKINEAKALLLGE